MGYNCAEAVNFACKNWLELGSKAKVCRCISDAVKIDMNRFIETLCRKKYLKKGEIIPLTALASSKSSNKQTEKPLQSQSTTSRSSSMGRRSMASIVEKENKSKGTNDMLQKKKKRSGSKIKPSTKPRTNEEDVCLEEWFKCESCNKWRKFPKRKLPVTPRSLWTQGQKDQS